MYQNDKNNYVKYWRSVLDNGFLMSDNNAFNAFMKLLICVDRHTGSFTTGRYAFAELCNMKPSTVRDTLKRLEKNGMIRIEPDYSKSKIYICNWGKYQSQPVYSPSTARLQPVQPTTLNKKEEREEERSIKPKRDVLGILNKVTGRNFSVEPLGIEKTKSLFTDEVIERALRNMYKEEWHKPRMGTLKSDYLLRATTIDQFKDYQRADAKYVLPGSTVKQSGTINKPLDDRDEYKKEFASK